MNGRFIITLHMNLSDIINIELMKETSEPGEFRKHAEGIIFCFCTGKRESSMFLSISRDRTIPQENIVTRDRPPSMKQAAQSESQ